MLHWLELACYKLLSYILHHGQSVYVCTCFRASFQRLYKRTNVYGHLVSWKYLQHYLVLRETSGWVG